MSLVAKLKICIWAIYFLLFAKVVVNQKHDMSLNILNKIYIKLLVGEIGYITRKL